MDYTHYIAIDFGTTGSGFAYATRANLKKVRVFNQWPGLKPEDYKTPTVLLIDPDKNLEAFGQEAVNKYYDKKSLRHPDRFNDYYFFRNFKMVLYNQVHIDLFQNYVIVMATAFRHFHWGHVNNFHCATLKFSDKGALN